MATHYEVLKIKPEASQDEIRRAYYAQARVWHPDRFTSGSKADESEAEARMRFINEAGRVLQDAKLRREYDASLAAKSSGARPQVHKSTIDPRLLDPEVLRRRSMYQEQAIEEKSQLVVRLAPYLALLFLLAIIFVYTGYATRPDDGRTPATVPGPDVPFGPGACIRVLSEGVAEVPNCDGAYQGRLAAVRLPDGVCTPDTIAEVVYKDVVLCLE